MKSQSGNVLIRQGYLATLTGKTCNITLYVLYILDHLTFLYFVGGNKLFLFTGNKAKRGVKTFQTFNMQCLENKAEIVEHSVLTLGFFYLVRYMQDTA